jgi:hypothetical protein
MRWVRLQEGGHLLLCNSCWQPSRDFTCIWHGPVHVVALQEALVLFDKVGAATEACRYQVG